MNLARLPSLLAIPLQEFDAETASPVMRLHRLCDAVEILTRFCTVLVLGEWRVRHDDALPQELTGLIRERQLSVERPTFGQWAGLLSLLVDRLDRAAPLVVQELPEFVTRHLLPLLGGGERTAWESLVALRNDLAHGGGMTQQAARDFLAHWEPRLRDLTQQLTFLDDTDVCLVAGGVARRLTGPSPQLGEEWPLSADLRQTLLARPLDGHVLLLRQGRWLDLWPLCAFGRAGTVTPERGKLSAAADSPLVYFRSPTQRLRYVALGSEWPFSEAAGQAVEEFRRLFQLDARVAASSADAADFDQELQQDAAALVGRKAELEQVLELVKAAQDGLFWLGGPGGIGKSYLTAALACSPKLRGDPKKLCLIAWRFKVSDQNRGTRVAFFRHAVTRLGAWLQRPELKPEPDAAGLWKQLTALLDEVARLPPSSPHPQARPPRVLFVLDGLDEIARLDADFATVPLLLTRANVIWLCAGRPEGRLPEVFTPQRCTHFFPPTADNLSGGLPAMSPADVRAMLLDGSGALKYQLLPLDAEHDGQVLNEAVEAVVQRAAGLPLYVHFVVEDVLSGHFRFREMAQRLPPSLAAYYEELLDRLTISDLRALLTPLMTTIAWARAPLDEDLLHLLMVRHKVLTASERGRRRLREGLEAVQGLVRLAPVPGGQRLGYEMYHPTFRDHIRKSESGKLDEQNELTRREFCELAIDWAEVPADQLAARDYAVRYGVPHLLEAEERDAAVQLLLDLPFLEAKTEAGLVFNLPADFAAVIHATGMSYDTVTPLELIDEAIRTDLQFIAKTAQDYPQGLMQSVVNYISPILAASVEIPGATLDRLRRLISDWVEHTRTLKRPWIKLDWVDRERIILGPLRWQAKMRERPPERLAFSPAGDAIAAASSWHSSDRPNPPAHWPDAYEVAVWSSVNGQLLNQLYPDVNSVDSNGPPENVPRPPEVDLKFREYFSHREEKRRHPPPRVDWTKFLESPKPAPSTVPVQERIERNVGEAWFDSLIVGDVDAIVWLNDQMLLAAARGGRVFVWDVRSGVQTSVIQQSNVDQDCAIRSWGETAALSLARLDDTTIAAGTSFGRVEFIKTYAQAVNDDHFTVHPVENYVASRNRIWALAYHEPSRRLAIGGLDKVIRIIDTQSKLLLGTLTGHTFDVTGLAWSPSGKQLASTSWDKTLRIWAVESGKEASPPIEHPSESMSVAWGPEENTVFSTWNENGIGGCVRLWDLTSGQLLKEFGRVPALLESLAVHAQKGLIASGGKDGVVRLYSLDRPGAKLAPLLSHVGSILAAHGWVPRHEVATLGHDGVFVWSSLDGTRLRTYERDFSEYLNWDKHLQYSIDGRSLAAVVGHEIVMFDGQTLGVRWFASAMGRNVTRCYFSADSKRFLTDDGCAPNADFIDKGTGSIVWDVATGAIIDRSGNSGLEAETRLREYEEMVRSDRSSDSADPGFATGSPSKWKSSCFKDRKRGITEMNVVASDETTTKLTLFSEVRHRSQLEELGQWVLILQGATAPTKATVVWPN